MELKQLGLVQTTYLPKQAFAQSKKLTKEEELELVKRVQQNNDMQAFRLLRKSLRPMIMQAIRSVRKTESEVDVSQLQSRISKELLGIIQKYDPNKGALSTHVITHATGHAKNALYEGMGGAHVPRPEYGKLFSYQQAEREAMLNYGPNPTNEQIKEFAPPNLQDDEVLNGIKRYKVKSYIGDATYAGDEGGEVTFKDMFQKDTEISNDDFEMSMKIDEIKQLMNLHLNPQERQVIEKSKIEGNGVASVALSLGLTSSEIIRIIRKWEKIYKQHSGGI